MDRQLAQDMRGASALVVDGIVAVTDLTESVHARVASLAGIRSTPPATRTRGLTGLVYGAVRGITQGVGKVLDAPLALLEQGAASAPASATQQALLSALNGVLGDFLAEQDNPLAIAFQLRRGGQALSDAELRQVIGTAGGKVTLLVHGACMNDVQWCREGHDHGRLLEQETGRIALYALYNTGLHISQNGEQLAAQIQHLYQLTDGELDICLVGHSMGGLVSRSALSLSGAEHQAWQQAVTRLVCIGSPHQGAILEKMGSWVDVLLQLNVYSAPFSALGKVRSAGIKDLRYGVVQQDDWVLHEDTDTTADMRSPCPLPELPACYAVASCLSERPGKLDQQLVGDGLVSLGSALGEHRDQQMDLHFPEAHKCIVYGVNHMELLSDPQVYAFLKQLA